LPLQCHLDVAAVAALDERLDGIVALGSPERHARILVKP
jgi:hypothetical protein